MVSRVNIRNISILSYNSSNLIETILSPEAPSEVDLQSEDYIENMQYCREIYGLFHSKYISTPNGN